MFVSEDCDARGSSVANITYPVPLLSDEVVGG